MYENFRKLHICALMEKVINDFNGEFEDVSEGEILYAEALAHLLDRDTKDYVELLSDDDLSFNIAADPGASYGYDWRGAIVIVL